MLKGKVLLEHLRELKVKDLKENIPVMFIESQLVHMVEDDDIDDEMFEVAEIIFRGIILAWRMHQEREETEENEEEIGIEIKGFN